MSKRSVFLLLVSAVLLTGFSVALSRRDSRDWRANRSRRLLPFPWQDTASIRIRRPNGEEAHFSRAAGEEWQIHLPDGLVDALNPGAAEELAALATLAWRAPLPDRAPPNPASAISLTAQNQGGQSVTLTFGDVLHNLRATCVDGDAGVVYGVSQDLLKFLDWPADRFRKLYLASVAGGGSPHRIVMASDPDDPATAITLERAARGWAMRTPIEWPADESRLAHLLRWLDRLRADAIVAETADAPARYGFDPPGAVVDAWYDTPEGRLHHRVEFGDDDGKGGVYARAAGRAPVFSLPAPTLAEIALNRADDDPAAWRNFFRRRDLDQIGDKRPVRVEIQQLLPVRATLAVECDPASGTWRGRLESGGETGEFAVDPPLPGDGESPLGALFAGLSGLRVKEFLTDRPPGPDTLRWTAYPAWRIAVRFADGSAAPDLTLYAADAMGTLPAGAPFAEGTARPAAPPDPRVATGLAFSLADRPAVLETFADAGPLLCLPPYRYRSRRLVNDSTGGWRRFERIRNGEKETFVRPDGEVNEQWWRQDSAFRPLTDGNNRFAAMLRALSQLDSEGFVSDGNGDIAEFGLDRPEISAIVYSSPGEAGRDGTSGTRLFELSLGKAADGEGRRYARLNGAGPVFLVSGDLGGCLGERYE